MSIGFKKMRSGNFIGTILGLAIICGVGTARATLIDDTVECGLSDTIGGNFICSSSSAVVGNGVEFTLDFFGSPSFFIDLDGSSIAISAPDFQIGSDIQLTLSSLDWVDFPAGVIEGFTLVNNNVVPQVPPGVFDENDITFGDHFVTIDLTNTFWNPGSIVVTLDVNHGIPEPSSAALFIGGLAFFALFSWRRRQSIYSTPA